MVPILAISQGDPAGVGPEILCKLLSVNPPEQGWQPLLVVERAAIAALPEAIRNDIEDRLVDIDPSQGRSARVLARTGP